MSCLNDDNLHFACTDTKDRQELRLKFLDLLKQNFKRIPHSSLKRNSDGDLFI